MGVLAVRVPVLLAGGLMLLMGCAAPTTFGYGGVTYSSRSEAFQAARTDLGIVVAGVTPAPTPIGGKALVVVPSRRTFEAHASSLMRASGAPPSSATASASGFMADVLDATGVAMFDVVQRGRIFDEVVLVRSDDPESESVQDAAYKVWLAFQPPSAPDRRTTQWYVSGRQRPRREPVREEPGVEARDRGNAFNRALAQAAAGP